MIERRNPVLQVDLSFIKQTVEPHINAFINEAVLINNGLANTNYQLVTNNNTSLLSRIHNDVNVGLKEYKISQVVAAVSRKIPKISCFIENGMSGHAFSIFEFIPGEPLYDHAKGHGTVKVYHDIADFLIDIAKLPFDKAGDLTSQLEINPFKTHEQAYHQYINFMLDCLASPNLINNTSVKQVDKYKSFILTHQSLLDCTKQMPIHLVHGDFKAENIIVCHQDNALSLAAVIDWEYARADIMLADIATLFRGYFPTEQYQLHQIFASKLKLYNVDLPVDWLLIAKYIDCINLLAFLDSNKPRANLYKQVIDILDKAIVYIENNC